MIDKAIHYLIKFVLFLPAFIPIILGAVAVLGFIVLVDAINNHLEDK